MNVKSLMIAGAAALSLTAPAAALADPVWNGGYQDGYYANHDYDHDGDNDRGDWDHHAYYGGDYYSHPAYGWGYHRHCWTQIRPYRTWFGGFRYERVTECRR